MCASRQMPEEAELNFIHYLKRRDASPNTIKSCLASCRLYYSLFDELNTTNLMLYKDYLVQHYTRHASSGQPLIVQTDYQTIASNIGVSVRTVVRSVSRLKELSEISVCKKKIVISKQQHERMQAAIRPLIPSEALEILF